MNGTIETMKSDISESCEKGERKSGRWLLAVTRRILAIQPRFPLASTGLLSIFDQAIFSGTSFLTAVFIGRATSPDELGMYYLVLSIILIISGVQDQIIASPFDIYSKRRQGRDLAEYAGSICAHHLAVTFVAVIGLLTAILALSIIGQTRFVPGLWALVAFGPILLFRQGVRRFAFANLEVKSAVVLDATVAVLQISALVLLRYLGWLSLFSIFAVIGGACGLGCVGWHMLSRPRVRFVRERIRPDWYYNWNFGKWALQTYVLANTAPQIMLWLVSAMVGPAATGVFGACNNLIGMCYVLLCGVFNVLTPLSAQAFATGGVRDLRRILFIAGVFFAVTMGGLCVFAFATGDWLVVLAFGPLYRGTGRILITLTLSTTINAFSMLTGNGLWAIDQPRANLFADVCSMTVVLITAAFLVHPYGAFGAALATLAGTTAATVVRSFTLMRCLEGHASQSSVAMSSALPS